MLEVEYYPCVRINVPDWYKDKQFRGWLVNFAATWHRPCDGFEPGECSDAFIWYDGGEGSDCPGPPNDYVYRPDSFPSDFWEELVQTLGKDWHGIVWLTNLQEA